MSGETTDATRSGSENSARAISSILPHRIATVFFRLHRVIEKCAGTKKRPGARPAVHKDCYKLDQGVG
jgi:hypothetical protein